MIRWLAMLLSDTADTTGAAADGAQGVSMFDRLTAPFRSVEVVTRNDPRLEAAEKRAAAHRKELEATMAEFERRCTAWCEDTPSAPREPAEDA